MAVWGIGTLPPNVIIKNPAGTYSFVGSVDTRLAFVMKDGSPVTEDAARKAREFGPGLAGVRPRVYQTAEDAARAAEDIGAEYSIG